MGNEQHLHARRANELNKSQHLHASNPNEKIQLSRPKARLRQTLQTLCSSSAATHCQQTLLEPEQTAKRRILAVQRLRQEGKGLLEDSRMYSSG